MNKILLILLFLFSTPLLAVESPAPTTTHTGAGAQGSDQDISLSDISIESLEKQNQPSASRNPFAPSTIEEVDPASLELNGTVVGRNAALCLISGRILKEGDHLGRSIIKQINPGEVILKSVWGDNPLRMSSYVSETSQSGSLFEIYFNNADLKQALQTLATIGGFNLILPEKMSGQVSLIFHQTDLKEALGSMLRVNKFEYAEENDIIRVGTNEEIPVGADFTTAQIPLNYAVAKDLEQRIQPLLSDKGKIVADERTNTLTIKDRPMAVQQVINLIQQIDQKDPQVHIEGKIMDVSSNFSRDLGIQWGFTRSSPKNVQGFSSDSTGGFNVNMPAGSPTSSIGILISNLTNSTQLQAAITAAEARGDIRVLSKPSVTTLNNTEAKIRSGLTIYYKQTSDISIGSSSGSSTTSSDNTVQSIETGIELTVTPQITPDNMIKMKIEAIESEADFSHTVDGIPAVIDNTATTTVLVHDGETAVIGGLIKTKKSVQKRGVPALSYIPILGWLFKSKAVDNSGSELLIFMTPKIIRENHPIQPPVDSAYYKHRDEIDNPVPVENISNPKTKKKNKKTDVDKKNRVPMSDR